MSASIWETYKIVDASRGPITTNGAITCDYVSLKNVHKAWIVVSLTQGVGHATGIDPTQATTVAGGSVKAITANCIIRANEDTATSDTLAAQTAGITYNVAGDVLKKQVIFEIRPEELDTNGGFDCLGCTLDASSQASNFASVLYILQERYPQAIPPAAITD